MPLRDDLLTPIAGDNPAGEDLYYDKVFELIREARREDTDDLPVGDWELSQKKKADHRAVIKLAGESLAKKSKDIRLAGWLLESLLRIEGFSVLAPGIELLRAVQETFWNGFYPVIEEGGDLELRILSVEASASVIAAAVRKVPLTRSGLSYEDFLESRTVGYEKDATTDAKQEARKDSIDRGRLSAEDFDQAYAGSPKSLYIEAVSALEESLQSTKHLGEFNEQVYGSNVPNLLKLQTALSDVHRVAESLLIERRKTDPDPIPVVEEPAAESGGQEATDSAVESEGDGETSEQIIRPRPARASQLSRITDAYALVVESSEFIFDKDPMSPVPYLVCAGLRLGETRMQGPTPTPKFAVGPSSEVRQTLRTLAAKGAWRELLRASLPILASECARAWIDLHRYVWQAAQETGAVAISEAVRGTVENLLTVRPELRYWTLEDDTGGANPETQQWLDATVLKKETS
ncbi:MAG: type VI secretion system protein TssA [Terracidiphilus sp.]|jgi:type VI secretion system protein ImpA